MDTDPQENSDLLTVKQKSISNGNVPNETTKEPPDGGFIAYAVMVGSFLTNGLLFGVINCYSIIYTELQRTLQNQGVVNAESRAALVGPLAMGTMFLLSPISGVLTAFMGLRMTAVLGGSIATVGLLVSSFVVDNVNALYFTYGIMYGLGASFAYTPSLAILGHYFKKYLGLVNGIVTVGSSIFTVFMASLMEYLINNYGLTWLFRILAIFTFGIALCGLLFNPISVVTPEKPLKKDDPFKSLVKSILNVDIWKNKRYKLWALSMPLSLFGYLVPYVHIKALMKNHFPQANHNLPLQCMAAMSGVGRIVVGYLADKKGIDSITLQQISFYVIGCLTIILPFVTNFGLLVTIAFGMGLFDGTFIALIGPIAFELCGNVYAAQAIGYMLGLAAIPVSVGPPIAGYLYGIYNSYKLPFILAGISPLVGATLMFSIRLHKNKPNSEVNTNGHVGLDRRNFDKDPEL
ncbi:monocarboxylate transporter 10 [Achroia grisella]|uniref:monocarboxylate transporter 10 n=1 Tax=Achroia grisella TaxID=688607 RepID=UPI0027D2EE38|nr:monocarboxylate transporter 10 [Achroia grisella]